MEQNSVNKPAPVPDEISRPFWDGMAEGVLKIQRCIGCGKLRAYPRLVCDGCYSLESEWIRASGRGTVHSWTVAHHPFHPGFKEDLPYVLVVVDLEEGVRALGRLHGGAGEEMRLGLPVQLSVLRRPDGVTLPAFARAAA
jgi:uncharacterized OB-fold protein